MSDLTDLDIFLEKLDPMLFPGVSPSVQVHSGFRNEHAQTASIILTEVEKLLASTGAKSVTCVRIISTTCSNQKFTFII